MGDALALICQNIATITAGLIIAFAANWILAIIILAVLPLVGLQAVLQVKFHRRGFSADAKVSGSSYRPFLCDITLGIDNV